MTTILTVVNYKPIEATVGDLLEKLSKLDPTTKLVGEFSDGHGEYSDVIYIKTRDEETK